MEPPKRPPKQPPKGAPPADEPRKKVRRRKKATGQPTRPLSAYNCFFKSERVRLLQEIEQRGAEAVAREAQVTSTGDARVRGGQQEGNDDRLSRRKNQGGTKFHLMGKIIGQRWKTLPPQEKAQYEKEADEEMKRYRREMDNYNQAVIRDSSLGRAAMERGTLKDGQSLPAALRPRGGASSKLPPSGAMPAELLQNVLPPPAASDSASVEAPVSSSLPAKDQKISSSVTVAPADMLSASQRHGMSQQSDFGSSQSQQIQASVAQTQGAQPAWAGTATPSPAFHNLQLTQQLMRQQQQLSQSTDVAHVASLPLPFQHTVGQPTAPASIPPALLSQLNPAATLGGLPPPLDVGYLFGGTAQSLSSSLLLLQQLQQQQQAQIQLLQQTSGFIGGPLFASSGGPTALEQQIEQLRRSQQENRPAGEFASSPTAPRSSSPGRDNRSESSPPE